MPFIQKPDGMSPEALEMLDQALTKLWLDQIATSAAKMGSSFEMGEDLREHVRRLTEVSQRRTDRR